MIREEEDKAKQQQQDVQKDPVQQSVLEQEYPVQHPLQQDNSDSVSMDSVDLACLNAQEPALISPIVNTSNDELIARLLQEEFDQESRMRPTKLWLIFCHLLSLLLL